MFKKNHVKQHFEDSFNETWVENEELNPLEVDRLGYRSNESIILEFIRAGTQLVDSREGYTNDEDFVTDEENYFETINTSVDSLKDTQDKLENSYFSPKSSEFSTGKGASASKNKDATVQPVVNSETSPLESEEK